MTPEEASEIFKEVLQTLKSRSFYQPSLELLLKHALNAMIKSTDIWGFYLENQEALVIKENFRGSPATSPDAPLAIEHQVLADGAILALKIPYFTEALSRQLQIIPAFSPALGVIIDIRDNRGGDFLAALRGLELICSNQSLFILADARSKKMVRAEPETPPYSGPIILLCNHQTQSAAEVFAAGCKSRPITLLIGQKTFGKGTIQTHVPLKSGGTLTLTTEAFFLADETPVDQIGISPDILFNSKHETSPFTILAPERVAAFDPRWTPPLALSENDADPIFTLALQILKNGFSLSI